MSRVVYLDASAIVKLVVLEPESGALQEYVDSAGRFATSRIGEIEVRRAAKRRGAYDAARLEQVVRGLEFLELDLHVARGAAAIRPPTLRTLHAIHLATALQIAGDLDSFVTYDERLAEAARAVGLTVLVPA